MASRPKMDLDILRSLLQEGSFDVRYQDPQIEQHGDPRRWYEIRPYVPVLAGQVDDLLLAFEAVIAAVDDGLPLDDAIVKVRKMWDLYGPSDTSLGEGAAEPAAPAQPAREAYSVVVADATEAEGPMSDQPTRNLVLRFWELASSARRDIALSLGLISTEEVQLPEAERYGRALRRAGERGQLEQLAAEIEKKEKT